MKSKIDQLSSVADQLSILIVDDESHIVHSFGKVFEKIFARADVACDGREALEKYRATPFDLILTDLSMPVMSGYEMIKEVRAIDPEQKLIVYTAYHNIENMDEAFRQRVNGFITKPSALEEIMEELQTVCRSILAEKESSEEHDQVKAMLDISNDQLIESTNLLEQYRYAIDASAIVSKTDSSGVITYANDRFCATSGYSREALIGNTHAIVRDPQTSPDFFKAMWQQILAKQVFRGTIKNRKCDGTPYWVETTIIPICNNAGEIIEFISIRHDVTTYVRAYQELHSLDAMKGEFIRNMNHEIRTPLNAVVGMAQLARQKVDDPKVSSYLGAVISSAKKIGTLSDRILLLSELKSGSYHPASAAFMLKYELQNALAALEDDKGVEIEPSFIGELEGQELYGDRKALAVILQELLQNALSASPAEGKVGIRFDRDETYLVIEVSDRGTGVDPALVDELLKPFTQADGSLTRTKPGLGIGLALVRHLVEAGQGGVSLRANPEGGTIVTATIRCDVSI
jgi:PAS domain S-box-containing protein